MVQKCVSVSIEFSELAKENKISWSEAARTGMGMLFAERDIKPYDNKLNLVRKRDALIKRVEELSKRLEEIKHENRIKAR
jgi:hypothetical protein